MRDIDSRVNTREEWVGYEWTSPLEVELLQNLILSLKLEPEVEVEIRRLVEEMLDNAYSKGVEAGGSDF